MLLGHYQVAAEHFQAALRAEASAKVAALLAIIVEVKELAVTVDLLVGHHDVLVVLVVIDEEWRARIPGKAFLREVGLILGARRT